MRFLRPSNLVLLKGPAKVLAYYLLFSAAWIVGTDILFHQYLKASMPWHTLKGLLYVLSSGIVLFWLCRRLVIDTQRLQNTLSEIFLQTEFGICVGDEGGQITDCNEAFAQLLGFTRHELVGTNFERFVAPDERDRALEDWKRTFQYEEAVRFVRVREYLPRSGRKLWAKVAVSRIDPAPDQPSFLVALFQNITAEVEATEELKRQQVELRSALKTVQESETRFKTIVESTLTGMIVCSVQGPVLDANSAFLRMLGYSQDDLKEGKLSCQSLSPPEYLTRDMAAVEELRTTHRFAPFEKEFIAKDGTRIPVLISGSWLQDDNLGNMVAVVSVTDLRDARRTEEQLSRLVLAVESAYESIMITDLSANIIYVNPAFELLTGYTRNEILGQNARIMKTGRTSPPEYEQLWATLKEGNSWKGRFWNRRKDGSEYLEDVTISPVRDGSGKVINYLAVKRDITRENALEKRLAQSQKLEAVGQLTGGVAHDLNNVLQAVHSSSELGLRRSHEPEYIQKKLRDILTASQRGAGIIAQLLAFTRYRATNPTLTDLNEVITETGTMLRRLLPENVELVMELGTELNMIEADRIHLSQVLLNLAVNGRDAMPDGGLLRISSSNSTENKNGSARKASVRLTVQDTGIGMAADVKDKIFEPFFTTKEVGKGTGIGLATVHDIVHSCGGKISVESAPGCGTRFDIDFPASEPLVEKASRSAVGTAGVPELVVHGSIVVCEDDESVRTAVCDFLDAMGVDVIRCGSASEAIAAAQQRRPAILISDVIMPGQSGVKLAEELRQLHSGMRVLLMTGHTEQEVLRTIGPTRDTRFIQKPFTTASLMEQLRKLTADA